MICVKKKKINIIEDAAESLGSFYIKKNKKYHSGTLGTVGSISFNGNKIITSAGGGVVLTNNKECSKKISYWSNQARDDKIDFIHKEVGYNYRLSNIHAAIGFAQIEKINKINGLSIMSTPSYSLSNYWINILKVEKKYKFSKKEILNKLIKQGIQARPIWLPNHLQKPYRANQTYKISMANKIYNTYICLPSSSFLKEKEINRIVRVIK